PYNLFPFHFILRLDVWGFDYDAVGVLQQMKPKDDILSHKFAFLLRHSHIESQNIDESNPSKVQEVVTDSVTDRVAGFICKAAFTNHKQCVSGLAVVPKDDERNNTYLISAGWDRRIFIWNLDTLCLHDVFRHPDSKGNHDNEMAADGIIVDLVYCQERDEFAYCSADKLVYIRAFSEDGSQMKLKAVLQGHEAEVTQVRWNSIHQKWVTGSDDCTIRVWSADGMNCELVLSTSGGITAMCIDQTNGCVVVGIQEIIRVYDIKSRSLVQSNIGHRDCIRSLIHIPERQQYVSASWDKTVRAWNAFKGHKKKPEEEDNKEDEEESYENGS
uniref:Uncharacterized protein n=1 Tax=Clytia hemisphaerica TaxID=252671 RepID=A0A7M5UDS4_9CNID